MSSKKEQEKKAREKALKKSQKKEKNAEMAMRKQPAKQKKSNKSDKQQYFDNIRREKRAEEQKQKRKADKIKIAAVITVAVVVVAAVPVGVWYGVKSTGIFEKKEYFASTKHYGITSEQMSYYFMEGYNSFLTNYADYLDSYGIDKDKSPKEQYYNNTSQTWFDYLMENNLVPHIKQLLVFAEGAKSEKIKLTDEEKKSAETMVENLDVSKYGDDVSEKDIQEAAELELLAQKYYNNLKDSMDFSDDEINTYFDENKQDFLNCDYIYYTLSYSADGSDSSALTEEKAYTYAQEAAKSKTESDFENWAKKNIKEQYKDASDSEIDAQIQNLKVSDYECSADDERSNWFCDENTKVNDTKIFSGNNSYTVVMLLSEPEKDESITRNIRLVYLDPAEYDDVSAKADEIISEYDKKGKTEDAFSELAVSYSDDENTKYSGGLYENVTENYLVSDLNDWTFDDSRKTGDVEKFELSKGTYIIYYGGEGVEAWKSKVEGAMVSDKYKSTYESYLAKYPVTVSDDYTEIKAW